MVETLSEYSEQSQQLAKELLAKATKNLNRTGKAVHRDSATGRYVVTRVPKPSVASKRQKG